MRSKEIFHKYFKGKLITWVGIGIAATIIRVLGGHETSLTFVAAIFTFFIVAALILGYIDYSFYEKSASEIIAGLLDKEPLASFQQIGFIKLEKNKLEGKINNYTIFLSPSTNIDKEKALMILIPLQLREGLTSYFTKYDDHFRFTIADDVILAEAILKNYDKKYDHNKLYKLLDKTTTGLKRNNIEPLSIVDDWVPPQVKV